MQLQARDLVEIIVFVIVIVFAIYCLNSVLPSLLSTETPLAVVSSYSMEPTFHIGDLLIVTGVKPDQIRVGDIIVYKTSPNSEPIVHRVIAIAKVNGVYRYLTKGDANFLPDRNPSNPRTWISQYDIVGKVVFVIPYMGIFKLIFLKKWQGYTIIVLIIIVLILYSLLGERKKKKSI